MQPFISDEVVVQVGFYKSLSLSMHTELFSLYWNKVLGTLSMSIGINTM